MMEGVLNATDVRKDWGAFIDNVMRDKPALVKRSRDMMAAISIDHIQLMLMAYTFHMEYEQEENGEYVGVISGFGIVESGETLEEMKTALAKELIVYAEDYWKDFSMYYNSTNRRVHFPYVMNVLLQPDVQAVKGLIHA